MAAFWIVLVIALVIVVGNALILLRTAKKPHVPEGVQPKPYKDEDEGGW